MSGTKNALAAAQEFAASEPSAPVTPTGPFVHVDLTDSLSAFVIALNVFQAAEIEGSPPDFPGELGGCQHACPDLLSELRHL